MIEIFPIGSEVVVDGDIQARIVAVEIRGEVGLTTYQCVWWDEGKRQSEWLTEAEIKIMPKGSAKTPISFKGSWI